MCIRSVNRRVVLAIVALGVFGFLTCGESWSQGNPGRYNFGTNATAEDIAAVAIAIPADGKGLPPGKGDYLTGKKVYETTCAACHGTKLEGVAGLSNMPSGPALRLIGGRGTLASKNPVLTVESYWPYATTVFDYVRRAMPFAAPGRCTGEPS